MKILLIRPPAIYVEGAIPPSLSIPLGLLYIAAVLERAGHLVEVYDAQVNSARPVFQEPDKSTHMGYSWEDVRKSIQEKNPDIIGISCMFTAQFPNAIKTAALVKDIKREIVTVVGGSHPSVRPEDFFTETRPVDIVCIGEGEYTMLDIAETGKMKLPLSAIPGTAVSDNGKTRINQVRSRIFDLDALPLPAYHLIDMENYFQLYQRGFIDRPTLYYQGFERTVSIITSRGCPYNCIFCSVHGHMGKTWRHHSVDYVINHIKFLISKYRIKHIHFEDDNLSLNQARFKSILNGLMRLKETITWDTPNGVRADTLTKELIEDCKKSGCVYLIYAVESGSQRVLNEIIDKKLDLRSVIKAASWSKKLSLDVFAFYVIGLPGETRQEMYDTVNFALWLYKMYNVSPHLFIATPLPGTRLERILRETGIMEASLTPQELARMTQGGAVRNGRTYTDEEISKILEFFWKGYRKIFLFSSMLLLLQHPHLGLKLIKGLLKWGKGMPFKRVLHHTLLFKHYLRHPAK